MYLGTDLPFILKWYQFPIRLAFAMTINKSQGQTFKKVGLYLPTPVFSHGQFYVAASRISKFENLKIKIENNNDGKQIITNNKYITRNVVYKEILWIKIYILNFKINNFNFKINNFNFVFIYFIDKLFFSFYKYLINDLLFTL